MEASTDTDAELWSRCAEGDADAFGTLFERHADAVYSYCFTRSGSWFDAEELTSVTFLAAWRRRGQARLNDASLLPWLLGVATHVDHNRRRSARRHAALLARLPKPTDVPDIADGVAAKLDAAREVRKALDELVALPRRDADVALLCLGQGLTYAEAATALDIPVGTVQSRLARARRRLREAVSGGPDLAPVPILERRDHERQGL